MGSKIEAVHQHIPAWKKLGLKLKFVPEDSEPRPNDTTSQSLGSRKRPLHTDLKGVQEDSRSTKKRKINDNASKENDRRSSDQVQDPQTTPPKAPPLRKSVSFTIETKTQDGDSTKDLYNTWLANQRDLDPSFEPAAAGKALKFVTCTSINAAKHDTSTTGNNLSSAEPSQKKPKKKKKKRNKSKSTLLPTPPTQSTKSPTSAISASDNSKDQTSNELHPALTYLTLHSTSRPTWKFSKARESYLLKHLLDITRIPPPYNNALKSYLEGLQSQSARQRLVNRAIKIREEDEAWLGFGSSCSSSSSSPTSILSTEAKSYWKSKPEMDTPSKRKEAYLQAVGHHETLLRAREEARTDTAADAVWIAKVERRRRAEVVLWGLAEGQQWRSEVEAAAHGNRNIGSNVSGDRVEITYGVA